MRGYLLIHLVALTSPPTPLYLHCNVIIDFRDVVLCKAPIAKGHLLMPCCTSWMNVETQPSQHALLMLPIWC